MQVTQPLSAQPTIAPAAVGIVWYRIAVTYFALAVVLGVVMGAVGNVSLYSVHSHLNLLGWLSLAAIGLIYQHLPHIARNRVALMQFWLHNTGLPVMMLALTAKDLGYTGAEPILALGSVVVGVSVVLFAVNVLFCARTAPETAIYPH
jgi:hypothetical protein